MAGWRLEDNTEDVMERATAIVDKYPSLRIALEGGSSGGSSTPTKAETRTATRDVGVITAISSEPIHTPSPAPIVSRSLQAPETTAWQTIIQRQEEGNWFTRLYEKVDYGFGGFLPYGLPRNLVKAADIELKLPQIELATKAQARLEEAKTIQDFTKKSWYENFGIGYSPEEQAYQERATAIRESGVLDMQIPLLEQAGLSPSYGITPGNITSPISEGIGKAMQWGIPIAIAGIFLLSNKGK